MENSSRTDQVVAHGDELGYIFDAHDVFGKPLAHNQVCLLSYILIHLKKVFFVLIKHNYNYSCKMKQIGWFEKVLQT